MCVASQGRSYLSNNPTVILPLARDAIIPASLAREAAVISHTVDITNMVIIDIVKTGYTTDSHKDTNKETNEKEGKDSSENTKIKHENVIRTSFWNKMKMILSLTLSDNNLWVKIRVMLCFLLVLSVRGLNFLIPRLNKCIIDELTAGSYPVGLILLCTGAKFLQGGTGAGRGGGFVNSLKNILWLKVEQNTSKNMRLRLFSHLHHLGLRWHQERKTGEVMRIMDRGTSSITTLLNTAVFQVIPIMIDVIITTVYLALDLNIYFGLIIFLTVILYTGIAVIGTKVRTQTKREMNDADNDQRARHVDSLLNSQTVKVCGNEEYESEVYEECVDKYQDKEWVFMFSLDILTQLQNLVLNTGVLAECLYCGYLISVQVTTVGDFVMLMTYMTQLMQPLSQLTWLYRTIQEAIVNMENIFELLEEEEEVKNVSGALNFIPDKTDIQFKNVSFYYHPEHPILKDISFIVPEGKMVAIVGPSGSGKSTIINLLLRFYDPIAGDIRINDNDIRLLDQTSLRRNIGAVPQDTVLFNDTIKYNIGYGRIEASHEDIAEAAVLADLNAVIDCLPDGYNTKVGERGLKLSGGEKQRVAIARTFLKHPKILILDEATSALDTTTENKVQASLSKVCKGITCIVVAHRLSTVMHADQILVLGGGEIVERGTHQELLIIGGEYADMWNKQLI